MALAIKVLDILLNNTEVTISIDHKDPTHIVVIKKPSLFSMFSMMFKYKERAEYQKI